MTRSLLRLELNEVAFFLVSAQFIALFKSISVLDLSFSTPLCVTAIACLATVVMDGGDQCSWYQSLQSALACAVARSCLPATLIHMAHGLRFLELNKLAIIFVRAELFALVNRLSGLHLTLWLTKGGASTVARVIRFVMYRRDENSSSQTFQRPLTVVSAWAWFAATLIHVAPGSCCLELNKSANWVPNAQLLALLQIIRIFDLTL